MRKFQAWRFSHFAAAAVGPTFNAVMFSAARVSRSYKVASIRIDSYVINNAGFFRYLPGSFTFACAAGQTVFDPRDQLFALAAPTVSDPAASFNSFSESFPVVDFHNTWMQPGVDYASTVTIYAPVGAAFAVTDTVFIEYTMNLEFEQGVDRFKIA